MVESKEHKHRGRFTEGLLDSEVILKALNIKDSHTVLDAGCGNGYLSKIMSKKIYRPGKVYALDSDKYFIEALKKETTGSNIEAMEGDITAQTSIQQASLDLIYISTVIHGFSKQQMRGFIKEAKRLLKPDALLAIVEIEKKETQFGPPLNIRYSPEELKKIIPMRPGDTIPVGEYFYMQMFQNVKAV